MWIKQGCLSRSLQILCLFTTKIVQESWGSYTVSANSRWKDFVNHMHEKCDETGQVVTIMRVVVALPVSPFFLNFFPDLSVPFFFHLYLLPLTPFPPPFHSSSIHIDVRAALTKFSDCGRSRQQAYHRHWESVTGP